MYGKGLRGPLWRMTMAWVLGALLLTKAFAQAAPLDVVMQLRGPQGYVQFLQLARGPQAKAMPTIPPAEKAASFMAQYAHLFGVSAESLGFELETTTQREDRISVRLAQTFEGVPVFGGEALVQIDTAGNVAAVLANVLVTGGAKSRSELQALPMSPRLTAAEAARFAARAMSKHYPNAVLAPSEETELLLYAPELVGEPGPPRLAWQVIVASANTEPVREMVFVDARRRQVLLHFSLLHEALHRRVFDSDSGENVPPALVRIEGGPPTGIPEVDAAYLYMGDTYDFYLNTHGRDALDGEGSPIRATVRYCTFTQCPLSNAFWDGEGAYFGDNYVYDDIVAHELTHGVTMLTSDLIYLNEPGAINESFSDIWGEFVDLVNGRGDDSPGVRWLVGEERPRPLRDMADPPARGDPDRKGSELFFTGTADNGGVHINSGIGNKLCYLLTDGDTFNGRAIQGMGITRAAELFYEAQVGLLTSASDYADLYAALVQAAANLGWTQAEVDNLDAACRAVEIIPRLPSPGDFSAASRDGEQTITLTWTNPSEPFDHIIVRRKQDGSPTSPADGVDVYDGRENTVIDGPFEIGDKYFYAAWVYYGADDLGNPQSYYSYSEPVFGRAVTGVDPPTEFFTELFDDEDNDLDFQSFAFTPDGSGNFYSVCRSEASSFPLEPQTGTLLVLGDDAFRGIDLAGDLVIPFFGTDYGAVYIGSNGYITFEQGSVSNPEAFEPHFALPRASALYDDLDPSAGGAMYLHELPDRIAVTVERVPEWDVVNQNSFQIELFFNGRIRITYLRIDATDGLVGLSDGDGIHPDFVESDFSEFAVCADKEDVNADGALNSLDIQITIQAVLGLDVGLFDADVNIDGRLDAIDVQSVINAVLGVI